MRRVLARLIKALEADIRRIEVAMAATISQDPGLHERVRRIRTRRRPDPGRHPGRLHARARHPHQPPDRRPHRRRTPHPRQSGTSHGRCQAGRAPVRAVLYMATRAAIRSRSSTLRAFYERLRANGKPFKLAIVAAMRKFIVTLNAMLKNHQDGQHQPA